MHGASTNTLSQTIPRIAVLVLNYNGQLYLERCFRSLEEQTYPAYTIYLVDNGSSDRSIAFTQENFPQVNIISFSSNFGFAEAYNRAVRGVDEDYVVFLNNDTKCRRDWLEKLYKPIAQDPKIVAAGSRMVFAHNPAIINHGGGYFTLSGIGLDRDFGRRIDDETVPQNSFLTAYTCGGATLIKRNVFLQSGGFDPEYFIYFEDVDLGYRLWMEGHWLVHVPDSVVYHYFSPVFGPESPAKLYLCQKNRLANITKHFHFSNLVRALIISMGYDLTRLIQYGRKTESRQLWAVVKGGLSFLGNIPRLIYDRKMIQKNRKRTDRWLRERGLLLSFSRSMTELKRLRRTKTSLFSSLERHSGEITR